jgi:hypothetical protein
MVVLAGLASLILASVATTLLAIRVGGGRFAKTHRSR